LYIAHSADIIGLRDSCGKMRNGDATFLPKGTLIFSIENEKDSVAAQLDGKYYRFTKSD
jgi:hypothetical protein